MILDVQTEHNGVWFQAQFQGLDRHDIWRCGKCQRGIVAGFKGPMRARLFVNKACGVCHGKVHAKHAKNGHKLSA